MFQKRDLTCKRSRRLHVLQEERLFGSSRAERDFWAHLGVEGGGPVSAAPAGPPGEDEEYEQEVNEMNMVWEVRKGLWVCFPSSSTYVGIVGSCSGHTRKKLF